MKAPVTFLLGLVLTITGTVIFLPRPAGADQVSDLQAAAAHISQELILEQLQVGGYEQQYAADQQKVAGDQAAVAHTQAEIAQANQRIMADRHRLATEAINAYTSDEGISSGTGVAIFEGDQKTVEDRLEYEQLSEGDIDTAVDQLHQDEHVLVVLDSSLRQEEASDEATTAQEGVLTSEAQATQQSLESQQAQVNGALAVAVAQQQAAEAAAARAAVQAAQQQAAQQAAEISSAGAGASGADEASASSDPSLNPFLTCVVQAESSGNYGAVSANGEYMGAFQFSQATWNEAAQLAGMPSLIGVPPNEASPADQDALAVALYAADGESPWYDPCRSS